MSLMGTEYAADLSIMGEEAKGQTQPDLLKRG